MGYGVRHAKLLALLLLMTMVDVLAPFGHLLEQQEALIGRRLERRKLFLQGRHGLL